MVLKQLLKYSSGVAKQAGFTMIELLVVISVIGVLAVAVLSSINPVEQINKGRDTRTRSDAAQLINATDRYFAIHERYPWNTAHGTWTPVSTDPSVEFTYDSGQTYDWAEVLAAQNEIKDAFVNRIDNDQELYIYKPDGLNSTLSICFTPRSNAFQSEAVTKCGQSLTPDASVFCASGAEYLCLP